MKKYGILLVNLGTPDSPAPKDVYKYLIEFLTDGRVIDFGTLKRNLLVRGIIVPFRYKDSARSYQEIWTKEGSPLKVWGRKLEKGLAEKLGASCEVELAMRYQSPSLGQGLEALQKKKVDSILVFPLFPQYASASTGSVHQKVMEIVSQWQTIPSIKFAGSFPTHPGFIDAFVERGKAFPLETYDHVLFSFHGLPQRQLLKADQGTFCRPNENCCHSLCEENKHCYGAQCYATANAIADKLGISKEKYSVSFQSRLGKDPWVEPYTIDQMISLPKRGKKKVLVFCPAFICDCLETTFEIGVEYQIPFKEAGGTQLDLVPSLNDHPKWVEGLATMIEEELGKSMIKDAEEREPALV